MRKRNYLAIAVIAFAVTIAATGQMPRLIGIGCTNGIPVRFAAEESDFIGTCKGIWPLYRSNHNAH